MRLCACMRKMRDGAADIALASCHAHRSLLVTINRPGIVHAGFSTPVGLNLCIWAIRIPKDLAAEMLFRGSHQNR